MIAIITYSDFPSGTAGAIRVATFAHTLIDMGYEVAVFHKSKDYNGNSPIISKSIYSDNKYSRFWLFGLKVARNLRQLHKGKGLQGVIIGADVHIIHATIISIWCMFHKITCIFDVTEWYSKEQFANWLTAMPYWAREILNRFVICKRQRVIAISSYLQAYFKHKGCKVVRIPIIYNEKMDDSPIVQREINNDKLCIIYAGSHLKMDNIPLIIESIALLSDAERRHIQFIIYGLSEDKIRLSVSDDVFEKVQGSLKVMGRRPNKEVLNAYSHADFSIVLRDPTSRVNRAGFPSKVVESMNMGVPVICNYSSDLDLYLIHKENSIIIDSLDAKIVCNLFQELIAMSISEKNRIGQNAITTVRTQLNSKQFEKQFRDIVS